MIKQSEASIKSRMKMMTSGANQNFDQKTTSVRNFEKIMFFCVIVSISMYSAFFKGLVCMGMPLNIIFKGYTSYSIIWNHIQSYLNHIQK